MMVSLDICILTERGQWTFVKRNMALTASQARSLKEGDEVTVLYDDERVKSFVIYKFAAFEVL